MWKSYSSTLRLKEEQPTVVDWPADVAGGKSIKSAISNLSSRRKVPSVPGNGRVSTQNWLGQGKIRGDVVAPAAQLPSEKAKECSM
ncbi:hypothetical protein J6590_049904 [Homalodisca vitripennis]|nr:hypothetical protein J6590_049904 [Homalodisca vitripennis]